MKPALVVSCYTMGLGVIRSLGERGVPIVAVQFDRRDIAQHSRHVVDVHHVPTPERHEDAFVSALVELGRRYPGALLVPAHDAPLVAIARHRRLLGESLVVAAPEWETVHRCIDKRQTYQVASEAGVPVPRRVTPRSIGELEEGLEEIGLPLLVKPSWSHLFVSEFGTKMVHCTTAAEARRAFERSTAAGLEVMLQEVIPGPPSAGVNLNSYTVAGEPVAEFTARKVRNSPSLWGSPRVAVSEFVEEVRAPGRRLMRALGIEGFANSEWKQDERDGIYKLMEVNARHNLSSLLAVRCGVEFPWIDYRFRMDGVVPEPPERVEQGRYWIDLVRDLASSLGDLRSDRLTVGEFLKPYLRHHVGAHWSWRDPLPGLARGWDAVRNGRRG
jgi:D-aspartate ligase